MTETVVKKSLSSSPVTTFCWIPSFQEPCHSLVDMAELDNAWCRVQRTSKLHQERVVYNSNPAWPRMDSSTSSSLSSLSLASQFWYSLLLPFSLLDELNLPDVCFHGCKIERVGGFGWLQMFRLPWTLLPCRTRCNHRHHLSDRDKELARYKRFSNWSSWGWRMIDDRPMMTSTAFIDLYLYRGCLHVIIDTWTI